MPSVFVQAIRNAGGLVEHEGKGAVDDEESSSSTVPTELGEAPAHDSGIELIEIIQEDDDAEEEIGKIGSIMEQDR